MSYAKEIQTIYFAGKVSKNGFRQKIFGPRVMSDGYKEYDICGGRLRYGGPFALSDNHGSFHQPASHGLIQGPKHLRDNADWPMDSGSAKDLAFDLGLEKHDITCGIDPYDAVTRCITQIKESDAIVAIIESMSCYGTLIELGYASALYKPIYIYFMPKKYEDFKEMINHELWFLLNLPNVAWCGSIEKIEQFEFSLPQSILVKQKSFKTRYLEYLQSDKWKRLRKVKINEAEGKCQLCNSPLQPFHIHHRTYDRVFNEELSDLIVLCKPCHEKFHDVETGITE